MLSSAIRTNPFNNGLTEILCTTVKFYFNVSGGQFYITVDIQKFGNFRPEEFWIFNGLC